MQLRQHGIMRVFDVEHFLWRKIKVAALFVTQVGVGVTVANDLAWFFYTDSAVICSDDDACLFLRQETKQIIQRRMLKPG